ncbi:MAG: hypothetical protein M1818_003787 [Claussenomyces sp. TS43310]|nr:MAG: hypothetical protein M1818_003787 [Claussenomyces sp. TS43310]
MAKQALLAAIDGDRDKHVAFLQAFLRAPSPNPPGDTVGAAKVLCDYLRDCEISPSVIGPKTNMANVVSDFVGGAGPGPRVVMNGHMDVFPVSDGDSWTHSPWSGHNDGVHLYARGAVDMKAGTAASVIAYSYLHQRRKQLKGSLALTAVSDEETGGKWGSRWLLDQDGENSRWRGDCMINAEPGGMQTIRFGEKGSLRLTFIIRTPGAHGAYLHLSEGANRVATRLAAALLSVEDIVPPDTPESIVKHLQRADVRAVIDECMGPGAANLAAKPTLNIGTMHGGVKVNMIPELCTMETDIRLPIGLTKELVLDHIHDILKSFPEVELQVQDAASNPASHCPPDHPLLKAIAKNAKEVTGREPLGIPSLGATDTKFWRYLGIPAYVYGPSPASMASKDERVLISEFIDVIKTHACAVWEYLEGP